MSPTHWLIVIGVLVLLFGAKKLPEAARAMGRSSRILKAELHGLHDDPTPPDRGAPQTGIAPNTAPQGGVTVNQQQLSPPGS